MDLKTKGMKQSIIIFVLLLMTSAVVPTRLFAHGGEDHGDAKSAAPATLKYFSSEASSDKYELLVKYGELVAGREGTLRLFLSDAATNRAIDSATIEVAISGLPGTKLTLARVDTGMYEIKAMFPANKAYDLQFTVNSSLGPDLLQVSKVEIGKKLMVAEAAAHAHWYDNTLLWGVAGLVIGLLIMYILMKKRNTRVTASVIFFMCLVPVADSNLSFAHGGEDHGDGKTSGGGLANAFIVEKESQFLFNILTQPARTGDFRETNELLGTIIAAPQGRAVIQTPQTGKIISLLVRPGQSVSQGQTLVTIEQQIDAGTQVDMISQRNSLNAEVKAAKVQLDRLKSIEDIAAKKDVTEARARYEAAVQNVRLFNANVGKNMGSSKMISLTSPISGIVGTFNYAIGAVVNSGETLFEITNLNRVYVETQEYSAADAQRASFVAFSTTDTVTYPLRIVSTAQSVNTANQAQRMLFEIENPAGKFKIGENVRVLKYGDRKVKQLSVPASAVTDVNGKPAVFIKDKAEQYSISFIQRGEANSLQTVILKGAEDGEKIVTENVYQLKMIYLNQ
jgi:membrane fusion protein, heavy metal efflux system